MKTAAEKKIAQVAQVIRRKLKGAAPKIGLILGSGLDGVAGQFKAQWAIPYAKIPGFPKSSIKGHAGVLSLCQVLPNKPDATVLIMQGRFHYYEGYDLDTVTLPVRVMGALGIETLMVTNASGGIGTHLKAPGLMLIADHLNLLGVNPLRGKNLESFGTRFPDMTAAYDPGLLKQLSDAAQTLGIELPRGVYAALPGPSYETPAEVRMLRILGADAVGMSTVPEVIVARHQGMRVAGISMIANLAAGLGNKVLLHDDVVAASRQASESLGRLLKHFLTSTMI